MTPLDAGFLELEDEDRHASLHVASVSIFEPPAPSYDEFCRAVAGKLPLIPRYRQKVRRVPLELGPPVWVDDPHFDLRYHVRQTALPAPGGEAELRRLLGRLMSTRLDRDRPLWESWVVEGLEGGAWALVSKVHHCLVDGVSGIDLLTVLLDLTPEPSLPLADDWTPRPEPSDARLVAAALAQLAREPYDVGRATVTALRSPAATLGRAATTARGLARYATALVPHRATSLSGPIGTPREYAWARGSLADVRTVRQAFGVTVNDVVLAAITAGLRQLLLERGDPPRDHTVRSLVPVNVRRPGEEGIRDNRVSAMLADLPVHVADPVARLREVRHRLTLLKLSGEAPAGETLTALARLAPFEPVALGLRTAFRLPNLWLTTVTTNVPGPQFPLYAGGRRLVETFPYVPIADRVRVGIAIFSYCGDLTFGVTADRDSTPDVDVLTTGIEEGLAELVKAAEAARPG